MCGSTFPLDKILSTHISLRKAVFFHQKSRSSGVQETGSRICIRLVRLKISRSRIQTSWAQRSNLPYKSTFEQIEQQLNPAQICKKYNWESYQRLHLHGKGSWRNLVKGLSDHYSLGPEQLRSLSVLFCILYRLKRTCTFLFPGWKVPLGNCKDIKLIYV